MSDKSTSVGRGRGNRGRSNRGGGAGASAFSPSEAAISAIAEITRILERLAPRDRGYVASRVARTYAPPAQTSAKQTVKKPSPAKQGWKDAWEKTPEYRAWQNAKMTPEAASKATDEERNAYKALMASALRAKRCLQGKRDPDDSGTESGDDDRHESDEEGPKGPPPPGPPPSGGAAQAVAVDHPLS